MTGEESAKHVIERARTIATIPAITPVPSIATLDEGSPGPLVAPARARVELCRNVVNRGIVAAKKKSRRKTYKFKDRSIRLPQRSKTYLVCLRLERRRTGFNLGLLQMKYLLQSSKVELPQLATARGTPLSLKEAQ
jgi:hypothetical protein